MVCGVEGNHHKVGARRLTETPLAFLTEAVREVVLDFAEETVTRQIVWGIGPLPKAYGDVALVRIVMTNLVGNAVKYTRPRNTAQITIGCLAAAAQEITSRSSCKHSGDKIVSH